MVKKLMLFVMVAVGLKMAMVSATNKIEINEDDLAKFKDLIREILPEITFTDEEYREFYDLLQGILDDSNTRKRSAENSVSADDSELADDPELAENSVSADKTDFETADENAAFEIQLAYEAFEEVMEEFFKSEISVDEQKIDELFTKMIQLYEDLAEDVSSDDDKSGSENEEYFGSGKEEDPERSD
ncbi:hypothetical protein HELRODRAFT_177941 [Helobdella robusta]|uniref:Uncharacterized protein n=1 Tax=Helobdella robusta TaxID=6412 RepID=T1FCI1_HELRO|nr:hypothetical protein HELRODRAFT_177941 [Helobdella robusta]ESN97512.1 hypothetical protein HELRODRAFT_177941 [Helobdella robusta]